MFWCKSLTDIQRQKNIDIYFCGLGFQALCFFSQFYLAGVRLMNIYIKIISHWKSKNSGGGAGRMYLGSPTINHCIYCCTVLLCSSTSFGETTIQTFALYHEELNILYRIMSEFYEIIEEGPNLIWRIQWPFLRKWCLR